MVSKKDKSIIRKKRQKRVRAKVKGTAACPRLCVFRSSKNIYAQIIDDVSATTLVSASTKDKDFELKGANKESARAVGVAIANKAKAKGIETVVFDRNGYLYHGKIKELAEGAREGGLSF